MHTPKAAVFVVAVILVACSETTPRVSASSQSSADPESVFGLTLETGVPIPSATLEPPPDLSLIPSPTTAAPTVTPITVTLATYPETMAELVYETSGGTWWTFDDCERSYLPGTVDAITSVLVKYGVKRATFFMNGDCYVSRPDLVRLITGRGFEIGNHAYQHIRLSGLGTVPRIVEAIRTGPPNTKFFRPPVWDVAPMVRTAAAQAGYTQIIMTSINTGDSSEANTCPTILKNLGRPGTTSIVTMHMTNRDTPKALEAYFSGGRCQ